MITRAMCKVHDVPLNGHPHWRCKVNEYEAANGIPLWTPSFRDMECPTNNNDCFEDNWEMEILP